MITFVVLGSELTRIPKIGNVLYAERSIPQAAALCFARIAAARKVDTEYFSILDGAEDILLDTFEQATLDLCNKLTDTGLDIGSARSKRTGSSTSFYMNHSVICRTSAFKALVLPESGCFHFETMVYPMLGKRGIVEHDVIVYEWIPSPGGANGWVDTRFARVNGSRWANRLPPAFVPPQFMWNDKYTQQSEP